MVTGSRRGEVSALRWRHLDLVRGLLRIERSNAHPKAGVREKETKTRQRSRVTLDPQTVDMLAAHRERCRERCAALGVAIWTRTRICSRRPRTARRRGRRARSPSDTAISHASSSCAAPGFTRCGTTQRPSSSRPASTSARSLVAWAMAAAAQRHSRSTRHGWTRRASARRGTMAEIMPQLAAPPPRAPRGPYEVDRGESARADPGPGGWRQAIWSRQLMT